jgi:hypothetical protein
MEIQAMSKTNKPSLWQRTYAIPPGMAVLLGFAIGAVVATIAAFQPPRDFSYGSLLLLLGTIPPFWGISGYILWLSGEPARMQRVQEIAGVIAIPTMVGILVAFPGFWWKLGPTIGPAMIVLFMGFLCALSMFAVAVGYGAVHLAGYLASLLWRSTKPVSKSTVNGIWDRELDVFDGLY